MPFLSMTFFAKDSLINNYYQPPYDKLFLDTNRIKAYFPTYSQGKYFDTILDRFVKLFNIEFAEAHQNWQNTIDNFCGLNSIHIMTIHKSKGLEYSAVFITISLNLIKCLFVVVFRDF